MDDEDAVNIFRGIIFLVIIFLAAFVLYKCNKESYDECLTKHLAKGSTPQQVWKDCHENN
jgi:hypothetical protein